MKTMTVFFTVLLLQALIFSQNDSVKQITNFDFDSRNPVFLYYPDNIPVYQEQPELFFETVYNDSSRSISSIQYNAETDRFNQLSVISHGPDSYPNVICRNAQAKYIQDYSYPHSHNYKMLIWETNENGNWDIAFSIDSGSGWTEQAFLIASKEDEMHPAYVTGDWYFTYPVEITYSQGNSVYLYQKGRTEENELIFQGNDSVVYSYPAGTHAYNRTYVVAEKRIMNKAPHIVYRYKGFNDTSWSAIQNLYEGDASLEPKFINNDWDNLLSFGVMIQQKKRIFLMYPYDFGSPDVAIELMHDTTIETSDFESFYFTIITDKPQTDYNDYFPYVFSLKRNDSSFVRTNFDYHYYDYYYEYISRDYYTKVPDPEPNIGPLAFTWDGIASYAVWEDSSDNRINLFGLKRIDVIGDVSDPTATVNDFILFQNYPNPFNPTTNIGFRISEGGLVTLKVYNVLGKEIITLINEEKPSGNYEIEFDAANLPSGIYFYQLKVGNNIETKKMILMK